MASTQLIDVALLLLDDKNPRLHNEFSDQRAVLEAMLRDEELGPKIITLAEDIAKWGPSPAELLIVTPEGAPANRCIVVEGNRRLAAFRILHKPSLADEVLSSHQVKRIRDAARVMKPVTKMGCVVFDTRVEADHWIELRHGGELGGAGTLRWDAKATDRYRSRHTGAPSFISQVLDFLVRMGIMPDWYATTPGRFPTTTLDRLLIGKEAREAFGLGVDENKFLLLLYEPAAVATALAPVVNDLLSGKKTVSDWKRKLQREQYIAEQDPLPKARRLQTPRRAESFDASEGPHNSSSPSTKHAKKKGQKPTKQQRALIPKSANLNITQPRINDLYHELQDPHLEVDEFPNAAGVLFRVFLELSIDAYILAHKPPLLTKQQMRDPNTGSLANKINTVANSMKNENILTKLELLPVRRLTQGDRLFDSRVTLMNGFVHNNSITPRPSELKAEWNDLTDFFRKLWP